MEELEDVIKENVAEHENALREKIEMLGEGNEELNQNLNDRVLNLVDKEQVESFKSGAHPLRENNTLFKRILDGTIKELGPDEEREGSGSYAEVIRIKDRGGAVQVAGRGAFAPHHGWWRKVSHMVKIDKRGKTIITSDGDKKAMIDEAFADITREFSIGMKIIGGIGGKDYKKYLIPPGFIVFFSDALPILIMEDGCKDQSLCSLGYQLYVDKKKFGPLEICQIGISIAKGLEYLHNLKPVIIHGDIKSPNIVVQGEGGEMTAKIIDFGCAQKEKFRSEGTLEWMAPEVLLDEEGDHKVDIYSFAMLMLELVSGEKPWKTSYGDASGPREVPFMVARGKRPMNQLSSSSDGWPEGVYGKITDLVTRCWSPKSEDRPEASEIVTMLEEIQKALKKLGAHPKEEQGGGRRKKTTKRKKKSKRRKSKKRKSKKSKQRKSKKRRKTKRKR